MNSEDRKGVVAHVRSWIQSLLDKRHSGPGQAYLLISGMTVLLASCFAVLYPNPAATLMLLAVGFTIAYLVERSDLMEEKLLALRNALLDVAFQECCCKPNSIIMEAPGAPELVGKPVGKGCCHVCKSRALLEERFPGAIEELMQERLNAFEFEESYIPEDLAASYFTPEMLAYLRERRLDRVGPKRFVPLTFTVRKLRK